MSALVPSRRPGRGAMRFGHDNRHLLAHNPDLDALVAETLLAVMADERITYGELLNVVGFRTGAARDRIVAVAALLVTIDFEGFCVPQTVA